MWAICLSFSLIADVSIFGNSAFVLTEIPVECSKPSGVFTHITKMTDRLTSQKDHEETMCVTMPYRKAG